MPTIIGDEFGGTPYTPKPKPKPFTGPAMSTVFTSGRSGRERDTAPPAAEFRDTRNIPKKKAAPPPIPTETVVGDELGGTPLPKPKKKGFADLFGPGRGRAGAGQSTADPDHKQAEREFGGFF